MKPCGTRKHIAPLHTDLLEEAYGPVSIRLLRHDSEVREAHLVDRHGISRTFAVTFLAQPCPDDLVGIDAEIRAGAPIGTTFRRYGYEVRKNVLKVLVVVVPAWLRTELAHPSPAAKAILSEFIVRGDGRLPELYGTVAEICSPDFRPPAITEAERSRERPTLRSLGAAGVPPEEVWQRLGDSPACEDADPRYLEAGRLCQREIISMTKRLAALLQKRK
jgi:hypothetical protein